jgi:Xanthine and CO dehydrogenases maturation factor, XdhC/CoxF family
MGELFTSLKTHLEQEQGLATATIVQGPNHLGARLLIYADGTTQGQLGNPELEEHVIADALDALWYAHASVHTYTLSQPATLTYEVFIEGFPPPPELIIVGAGHIAIPLTIFAKTLHYRVTVIDARAAFATPERFPTADELIVAWPDEVLSQRPLYPSTAIAVLTHDPKFDEPTLKIVLARHHGYIGAIGSRQTAAERAERLRTQGIAEEQLQRIHGPIGLRIGAATPEEIALAIMAEIVAVRRQKQ